MAFMFEFEGNNSQGYNITWPEMKEQQNKQAKPKWAINPC